MPSTKRNAIEFLIARFAQKSTKNSTSSKTFITL